MKHEQGQDRGQHTCRRCRRRRRCRCKLLHCHSLPSRRRRGRLRRHQRGSGVMRGRRNVLVVADADWPQEHDIETAMQTVRRSASKALQDLLSVPYSAAVSLATHLRYVTVVTAAAAAHRLAPVSRTCLARARIARTALMARTSGGRRAESSWPARCPLDLGRSKRLMLSPTRVLISSAFRSSSSFFSFNFFWRRWRSGRRRCTVENADTLLMFVHANRAPFNVDAAGKIVHGAMVPCCQFSGWWRKNSARGDRLFFRSANPQSRKQSDRLTSVARRSKRMCPPCCGRSVPGMPAVSIALCALTSPFGE